MATVRKLVKALRRFVASLAGREVGDAMLSGCFVCLVVCGREFLLATFLHWLCEELSVSDEGNSHVVNSDVPALGVCLTRLHVMKGPRVLSFYVDRHTLQKAQY